ncbi:MAG: hypothetical protein K8R39_06560 [Arcobacteraceae bacterium]|nr:hypothetical protein [Arcobacteraceae bacterium]
MLIIVQNQNNKRVLVKTIAVLSLFTMFWLYYQHMSSKFQEENMKLTTELTTKKEIEKKLNSKTVKLENLLYKEAVLITKLINQKNIQSIQIVKDKLLIVCDFGTNMEPVMIRYGVNAMLKSTDTDIKIALDIRTIVENKYES